MKTSNQLYLGFICAGAVALTIGTSLAKPPVIPPGIARGHGTDILHLFLHSSLTNTGVEPSAAGTVQLSQNEQGNANNQRLNVSVSGLETNNTYLLFAMLDDDTNFTFISDFNTDDGGNASLQYVNIGSANGNGNGHGNGHGHGLGLGHGHGHGPGLLSSSLLNPLSDIRQIGIFNGSTQAVLTADMTAPDDFQYLVKRNISGNGVDADLRIKATASQTQFRLNASGLNPTNDYFLVLSGSIVQTNSTDANGNLAINSLLTNPADILQVHTLALWDSASNSVVSTELP